MATDSAPAATGGVVPSTGPDVVIHDILWPDPADGLVNMLDAVRDGGASLTRATVRQAADDEVVFDVGEVVASATAVEASYRAPAAWAGVQVGDQALIIIRPDGRLHSAAVWDPSGGDTRLPIDQMESIGWLGPPDLLEWLWTRYGGCDADIVPDYANPAEVITAYLEGTRPCETGVAIPAWDFIGVVADVTFDEPATESDGLYRGGPDSDYRSGAMTVSFEDGSVVEVPTGTPGGNWCRDLATTGARKDECVLAGAHDATGQVAWFEVLDVVNARHKRGGGRHVEIFGIERLEDDTIIIRSIPFVVDSDITVQCHDDASTLPEAISLRRVLMADVSIPDLTVINVWCVYNQ